MLRSITPAGFDKPQVTLYGASPIFEMKGRGSLVVERLDQAGERQQIEFGNNRIKGRFLDFAKDKSRAGAGRDLCRHLWHLEDCLPDRSDGKTRSGAVLGRLLQMD